MLYHLMWRLLRTNKSLLHNHKREELSFSISPYNLIELMINKISLQFNLNYSPLVCLA